MFPFEGTHAASNDDTLGNALDVQVSEAIVKLKVKSESENGE